MSINKSIVASATAAVLGTILVACGVAQACANQPVAALKSVIDPNLAAHVD